MKTKLAVFLFAALAFAQAAMAQDGFKYPCEAYPKDSKIQKRCLAAAAANSDRPPASEKTRAAAAKANIEAHILSAESRAKTNAQAAAAKSAAVQPAAPAPVKFDSQCAVNAFGSEARSQCWASKSVGKGAGVVQPLEVKQPKATEPIRPVVMSLDYPVQEYHAHAFDYVAPLAKITGPGAREFTRMQPGMYSLINSDGTRGFSAGAPSKAALVSYFANMMVIPAEHLFISGVDYATNTVVVLLKTDSDWYKANAARFPSARKY